MIKNIKSIVYYALFIGLLITQGRLAAQTDPLQNRISLQLGRVTLGEALDAFEKQSGYELLYSPDLVPVKKRIEVDYTNKSLTDILQALLGNDARGIRVEGRQIRIQPSAAKGSVAGRVQTSDGQPAGYVTIRIAGQRSTQADPEGNFSLEGIDAGNYTISASYVGLQTQQQPLRVTAHSETRVYFTLSESAQTLQEVVVNAKTNPFADKETEYVARLPLKNLENAQVYNVVGQGLMKQQLLTSYAEVFQNVAGISTSNILNTRGTSFFLRGFPSPPSLRNGMAGPQFVESIEPVNIERVEVLKGPSATLFGSSQTSFGGAVNNVTKKPYGHSGGEIGYSVGSWGLSRLTIDYNHPLNADTTLLFRINAARHWANTFQDFGYQHNYAIAPSVSYQVNSRLRLSLEAEMNNYKGTMWSWTAFGPDVTAKSVKDLKIPYNRSIAGDQLLQEWTSGSVFAKADYKISDQWTSSTNFIQSTYYRSELYGMNNNEWLNDSTLSRAIFGIKPQTMSAYQIQQNFNGDFQIGGLRNRLVIGLDAFMNKTEGTFRNGPDEYWYRDTIITNDPASNVNVSKEVVLSYIGMGPTSHSSSSSNTYSIYASDVINLTDRLLAMLSLRVDRFDNKNYVADGVEQDGAYKQTALSPKFGLVYELVKDQVSLFGNYMNGFTNNSPGLDVQNQLIKYKPSQANQWEAGVKGDALQHRLSFQFSYYDISVKNALRYDVEPAAQDGTQYSRGFDAEIIANPFPGFNITAGYGYNRSRYEKAEETLSGQSLGAPENVANFWMSYQIPCGKTSGIGLGFGGNYVSEVTINRPILIPSYTLLNATLFYERPKYRIGFKVNNLGNQKYWSWDHVTGQPPRNFVANLTYKF